MFLPNPSLWISSFNLLSDGEREGTGGRITQLALPINFMYYGM